MLEENNESKKLRREFVRKSSAVGLVCRKKKRSKGSEQSARTDLRKLLGVQKNGVMSILDGHGLF